MNDILSNKNNNNNNKKLSVMITNMITLKTVH